MDAYSKIVFHRNIFIRSQDRVDDPTANSSNFSVNFSAGIHPQIDKDRFQELVVRVAQVDIPLTWYSVESGVNDNVLFVEQVSTTNTSLNIILTAGNYSGSDLATELASKLNAESTANGDARTYAVSYNASTNKLTYSYTGGNAGNTYIISDETGNNQYLGLPVDSSLKITGGAATPSTNVINVSRFPTGYIRSNIASLGRNLSGATGHSTDILAKFSRGEVPNYGIITINPQGFVKIKDSQGINGVLTFQLTDALRNIIGLNGGEWSIMLELSIIEPIGITLFNSFQKQLFGAQGSLPIAVTEAYGFNQQYSGRSNEYTTFG